MTRDVTCYRRNIIGLTIYPQNGILIFQKEECFLKDRRRKREEKEKKGQEKDEEILILSILINTEVIAVNTDPIVFGLKTKLTFRVRIVLYIKCT